MEKNRILHAVDIADQKAQYDANIKNLLANKVILAWILQAATEELKEWDIEEIISCIGDDIEISTTAVSTGETNRPEKILGDANENEVPYEGRITYDLRFHFWIPGSDGMKIKYLINVEAQKDLNKRYDMVTRGIFYGARMISAQQDTEFSNSEYQNIKKVYSIWICMNAPNYIGNAMTRYSITKEDLIGITPDRPKNYDKISIIMIYLNEKKDQMQPSVFHLLNTLLSPEIGRKRKQEILQETFAIRTENELGEELKEVCNLSEAIEERGIEQGIEQGMQRGIEQGIERGIEQGMQCGTDLGRKLAFIELIRNKLEKGLDASTIAEHTDTSLGYVRKVEEVIKAHPEFDAKVIVKWMEGE